MYFDEISLHFKYAKILILAKFYTEIVQTCSFSRKSPDSFVFSKSHFFSKNIKFYQSASSNFPCFTHIFAKPIGKTN
jgi:hypothetical protein